MSKKNRRALRRALISLSMMLVVAFVAVTGTIAWLTSVSSEVKNTFTVGKVQIELDEEDIDEDKVNDTLEGANHAGRDLANDYHLIPGATFEKDPIVWVKSDSDKAYVFLKVTNGLTGAEAADVADADPETEGNQPLNNTIEAQILANGWTKYAAGSDASKNETVYWMTFDPDTVSEDKLKGDDYGFATFTKVNIADNLTNKQIDSYKTATINVKAYAIQFNEIDSVDEAWTNVKDLK